MKSIVDPSTLVVDLGVQKRPTVISVVGTRGRISLFFWLAELLQASGRRVLVTTTTHTPILTSHWPVVFCHDPTMLPHASPTSPISFCFYSWKANQGEVQGFIPEAADTLVQRPKYNVVPIEADGPRGIPLEAPDEHEPCIPRSSCYVIAVIGGHTLGTKVGTENVHY